MGCSAVTIRSAQSIGVRFEIELQVSSEMPVYLPDELVAAAFELVFAATNGWI